MKVLMTKSEFGSDRVNGLPMPVKRYESGKEYDLGDDLAVVFLNIGSARIVCDRPKLHQDGKILRKRKNQGATPENKSAIGDE